MRLLIVSNRLPFTATKKGGRVTFGESAGGLVSGLSAYLDSLKSYSPAPFDWVWIGWPGTTVEDDLKEKVRSEMFSRFRAHPVFISAEEMESFYHGFCNKIVWPLFHYFPGRAVFDEGYWASYKRVNATFRDAVVRIALPGDVLWVHDYHLMLLPKLIREKIPDIPIGFFLHIPFPSFEIFRLLARSWSKEILEGLLGADLIGFHAHEYTEYFLRCVLRLLGHEHDMGTVILRDHAAKAGTFPMGIDFEKFHCAGDNPQVQREEEELKRALSPYRVILSIDRLDYTKGILNRLKGYEIFLQRNPHWHRKVVLVLVVVPSRVGVEHYQQTKRRIDELVGDINGKFGSIGWVPISYQYTFLPFPSLAALYRSGDVALVTPLRDGMNLIAKEYLAARTDRTGVLVLSEMAGAAKELGEAIIVNPNHAEEIAGALEEALSMPQEEQIRRNQIMQRRLGRHNVVQWAKDFINQLLAAAENHKKFLAKLLSPALKKDLFQAFRKSKRRLIFLDYDGTLVAFAPSPEQVKPSARLIGLLKLLSEDPSNEVVLISGRDRRTLERWFGTLSLGLAAEHGIWTKEKNGSWKLTKPSTNGWIAQIRPLLDSFVDRLPGSFVEEKEFSMAWHYRRADPDEASHLAKELSDNLIHLTANMDLQVFHGNKVVEIRNAGIHKGAAALCWLTHEGCDFVMAMGDDTTDEELFKALPEMAYTLKVGITPSYAKLNVRDHLEAIELLEGLTGRDSSPG